MRRELFRLFLNFLSCTLFSGNTRSFFRCAARVHADKTMCLCFSTFPLFYLAARHERSTARSTLKGACAAWLMTPWLLFTGPRLMPAYSILFILYGSAFYCAPSSWCSVAARREIGETWCSRKRLENALLLPDCRGRSVGWRGSVHRWNSGSRVVSRSILICGPPGDLINQKRRQPDSGSRRFLIIILLASAERCG